jgi:hypothetical protein
MYAGRGGKPHPSNYQVCSHATEVLQRKAQKALTKNPGNVDILDIVVC